jgi:hypothetical protein
MKRIPLSLAALALWAALASAAEPTRVELDLQRPDAKTTGPAAPLTPGTLDPLVLPAVQGGLEVLPPGAGAQAIQAPDAAPGAGAALSPAGVEPKAGIPGEASVAAGQVQFDLARPASPGAVSLAEFPAAPEGVIAGAIRNAASRKLSGVFIQQEQEGSLVAADSRDSSGNYFRWYRPVEMRPELMAQVQGDLGAFGKLGYGLKRSVNFWNKDPYAVWNAWSLRSKLSYLDKLEAAVSAEKGKDAAWKGKVSLILERREGAPSFITKNPHMEAPPASYARTPGARFLQPEIVSDKDAPAATINEAIGRSRLIIGETGHAGTQYHVFLKLEPSKLSAELPAIQAALQLVNDALFARAAQESFQNVTHASLLPWHAGRSQRVAELIAAAKAAPNTPQAEDADSEKHAFVGLRYWGMEGGRAVVSFELRGASLPWKKKGNSSLTRGGELEGYSTPERDYSQAQYYLTFLSLFAEKAAAGRAPRAQAPSPRLDVARAEALLSARARERGVPADAYYGVADFARRLSGSESVAQGYLFPFAVSAPGSPAFEAFLDGFLRQSARVRAIERAGGDIGGERRNIEYMFWSDYAAWARAYEASVKPRFEALFAASAS